MGSMQLTRGIGASISIGGRSYTKTNSAPVVFMPVYKTIGGKVWHYWAVLGRSKEDVKATTNAQQYCEEFSYTVNDRNVFILALTNGAFESGTLTISGPGVTSDSIQTGAPGKWYDFNTMSADNAAITEAELLLSSARVAGIAPRLPGGGKKVITGSFPVNMPSGTGAGSHEYRKQVEGEVITAGMQGSFGSATGWWSVRWEGNVVICYRTANQEASTGTVNYACYK